MKSAHNRLIHGEYNYRPNSCFSMKSYNKIVFTLLFIGFLFVGGALAKGPLLRVSLQVVGTDGKPVHGALITLQDGHEHPETALFPPRVRDVVWV